MDALTATEQFVKKNLKHNIIVNLLDGAAFWFGYSFYSPLIILPIFINHFTQDPIVLGLIPFFNTAGYLVPQLFTSKWVQQAPLKKVFPVNYGFLLERVPIALMIPVALWLAPKYPTLTVIAIIFLFAWHAFGGGFVLVGWQTMFSKVIPTDMRGRFLGITNFLGTGFGMLGAIVVTQVLARYAFPNGYVLAFSAAALLTFASWFSLSLTKEPRDVSSTLEVSLLDYLKSLPKLLRAYANFRKYMLSQIVISISGMANGFIVVYAVQHWNMPDSVAAGFTIAMLFGQVVANPLLGWLADHKGHKLSLEISLLLNLVSLVMAALAPSPLWFYPVFFLRGANAAGSFLSGVYIAMEFSSPEERPTIIGLANTVPGVAGAIAPLLGGWMALGTGYPVLFWVTTAVGLIGYALLRLTVKEPRVQTPSISHTADIL